MSDIVIYYLLKIVSFIISIFPRNFMLLLARSLGILIYFIFPKRKNVAIQNLLIAFPKKEISEIRNLVKKTYQHYMVVTIDFLRQKTFNDKNIFIDEKTKNILSNNGGMIFMTAHIGNWEMIIPILNQIKKTTGVVKVQRNSGGNKFISELRDLVNITLLPIGTKTEVMIEALNRGDILALASDQNAESKGMYIPFFGKKASIPKGPAYFYYKTKLPLLIGFCMLNRDNTYTFKVQEIKLKNDSNNIEELFLQVGTIYNKILENQIKQYPEQYFWFHRKWDRKIYK